MQIKNMGPLDHILNTIPGMGKLDNKEEVNEKDLQRVVAIIDSMTERERNNSTILNGSRKRRIARGSGTEVWEVNRVLKQFVQMKKMMKQFSKAGFHEKLRIVHAGT